MYLNAIQSHILYLTYLYIDLIFFFKIFCCSVFVHIFNFKIHYTKHIQTPFFSFNCYCSLMCLLLSILYIITLFVGIIENQIKIEFRSIFLYLNESGVSSGNYIKNRKSILFLNFRYKVFELNWFVYFLNVIRDQNLAGKGMTFFNCAIN